MTARVDFPPQPHGARSWRRFSIGLGLGAVVVPAAALIGPAAVVAAAAIAIIAWLSARPARGLALFSWLLPFHILAMAVLYGGLGLSAGVVRALAAWKEALVVACLLAAVVAFLRGSSSDRDRALTISWVDGAVAGLLLIATCHLIAAGPWLGSDLTSIGRAYAYRDIAFFLLLYFVGRVSGLDVGDNPATLSRLFWVGIITAVLAVVEYIFVPPELLAAIGTSRYFSEFLNLGAFTSTNVFGLPDNYVDVIGGRLIRRAGSTYLVSTAFAIAQMVSIAAASVLVFQRRPRARLLPWVGYAIVWLGLLLSITRMSIVAAVVEALVVALWYRRRGIAAGIVAATVTTGVLAAVLVPGIGEFLWDTVTFQTASSATHVAAWTSGIDVALAHPLGAGLGTTDETAVRFGAQQPLTGDNLFFKYAVELGLATFVLHIVALLGIGHAGWIAARRGSSDARQRLGLAVLALTIGILINGMTAFLYNSNFLAYVYFWLAGSAVTIARAGGDRASG